MRSITHRVFVYGTLKSGFWNHYLLKGREFIGAAATSPTYKMIDNGFPVIMPDPEGKPLAGEIYNVDDETLARLDQLEREGSSYDRKLIDVVLSLAGGERLPIKAFRPEFLSADRLRNDGGQCLGLKFQLGYAAAPRKE
jgi:gamma-glutamylcyclotransferase (GGCT)/AIG2-like uncharacterized protein YtfP